MNTAVQTPIAAALPHLANLIGGREMARRNDELSRLGAAALWQLERDLVVLHRHVPAGQVARAYKDLLRNTGQFVQALYEVRVAAMLAPASEDLELAPAVGRGKCDAKCRIGGHEVFFEVTTVADIFPFTRQEWRAGHDAPMRERVTVEGSFDSAVTPEDPDLVKIPESKDVRESIAKKARQLPAGSFNVVVVGSMHGASRDTNAALYGDPRLVVTRGGPITHARVPNGLFTALDDVGGASDVSAVVWMKLSPRFADVQVQGRLFVNGRAAQPLPASTREALQLRFDRRAVLDREVERIKRILIERYRPERIILFGSLAHERRKDIDRVHEWSDLDLFVVKSTSLPFLRRAHEVHELVGPKVAMNVVVYTPEEFVRAQREERFFVTKEILDRGIVLFP